MKEKIGYIKYKVYYWRNEEESSLFDICTENVDGEGNLTRFMNLLISRHCMIWKIEIIDIKEKN